jgi:hypothetical protein
VFIYTREAHPGEHVPHHTSFETKLAHAQLLRDELGIRRRILVDAFDGAGHAAYGLLPNMTWVIGRGGVVVYRADWTYAANVESFVRRYETGRSRRPPGGPVGPYATEQLEYRDLDRDAFYDRLHRNGPRSYTEFRTAERYWKE